MNVTCTMPMTRSIRTYGTRICHAHGIH